MNAERLKELDAKATPAPWQVAWFAQRKPIATSKSMEPDFKEFGLYGAAMEPTSTDMDMEIIAELRNALPEMAKMAGTLNGPALTLVKLVVAIAELPPGTDVRQMQMWDAAMFCANSVLSELSVPSHFSTTP